MFRHHSLFSVCHFPRSRLPFWLLLDGRLKWHSNYVRKNRPSKFQMWYIWNFDDFLTKSLVQTPVWQGCYTHSLHSASAVTQLIIGSGTSSLKTNKDTLLDSRTLVGAVLKHQDSQSLKSAGQQLFKKTPYLPCQPWDVAKLAIVAVCSITLLRKFVVHICKVCE